MFSKRIIAALSISFVSIMTLGIKAYATELNLLDDIRPGYQCWRSKANSPIYIECREVKKDKGIYSYFDIKKYENHATVGNVTVALNPVLEDGMLNIMELEIHQHYLDDERGDQYVEQTIRTILGAFRKKDIEFSAFSTFVPRERLAIYSEIGFTIAACPACQFIFACSCLEDRFYMSLTK